MTIGADSIWSRHLGIRSPLLEASSLGTRSSAFARLPSTGIALAVLATASAAGAEPAPELALGAKVYAEACASCHGAELEGQPDWQSRLPSGRMPAPPHDASGHTWHHADTILFRLVKEGVAAVVGGGYESDMPGFGSTLSDEEIRAVLAFIKSTWPERRRAYQAAVSAQEQAS
jgi:mono/diheme cytochrome c family protein